MDTLSLSKVDLHLHSRYSDGTCSPEELAELSVYGGLKAAVLTDHDNLQGFPEMKEACERRGLETLSGVELSTSYQGHTVHILCYGLDPQDPEVQSLMALLQERRDARTQAMIENLEKAGYPISCDLVKELYPDAVITRANIASVLLRQNVIPDISAAFKTILSKKGPYYVPLKKLTPEEAVSFAAAHHGVPVFAHPVLSGMCEMQLDRFTESLKEAGLKGIEGLYSGYTEQNRAQIRRLAAKYELLITGGSDFHGTNKPDIRIGTGKGHLSVPYECFEKLKEMVSGA